MRGINEKFITDLQTGCLKKFLEAVISNDQLWMGIRKNYINIYYCGGNAIRITQKRTGYEMFFDINYCNNKPYTKYRDKIQAVDFLNPAEVYDAFPCMLEEMDSWFESHPKPERTFQHKLLKDNPQIIDIEYAGKTSENKGFRLDMLAISDEGIIIVENKYGNKAIGGKAGLAKHHNDIVRILDDEQLKGEMIESAKMIAANKAALKLSSVNVTEEQFEILLLLADYRDAGKALQNEIDKMTCSVHSKVLIMDSTESIMELSKARSLCI
jgi:hypothetical protein